MEGWEKIGIILRIVFTGIGQQSAEIGIFQTQTEFESPFIPFIPPGSIGSQYLLVVFKKVGQGWFLDPFIILERRNGIIIPYVVDQILTTGFNRKNIGNRIGIIQFESIISLLKIGGGSLIKVVIGTRQDIIEKPGRLIFSKETPHGAEQQ